jgi:hypothetical protein
MGNCSFAKENPWLTKLKLEDENSVSRSETEKYCFVENQGNIIRMICKRSAAMPKEYN